LWRGQVGVLLPLIEEERQSLLTALAGQLCVPWRTDWGEITDLYDLEIGHIYAQMANGCVTTDREVRRRVRCLKEIRNELAHLRPAPSNLLASEEIGWLKGRVE
jgi:hypothetical protein